MSENKPRERKGHYKYKLDYCIICRFGEGDGSINEHHLDHHHIDEVATAKSEGRKVNNKAHNLITVCGACHRKIHNGEIEVDGYYQTTNGKVLRWKYAGEDWQFSDYKRRIV